jgi:protein subunit release factor A
MVNEDELKIDVFRSSGRDGAGGWAVRITHLPTATEVTADGKFESGVDPKPAIEKAALRLRQELTTKLEDGHSS